MFHRTATRLRQARGHVLVGVAAFGAIVGIVGSTGFEATIEHTSTTEFCLSCHEMKAMQEELARTVHFKNRAGVRVECGDCHVPKDHPDRFMAKVMAVGDLYAHVMGSIDTPEKFEARRLAMAEAVWAKMRADGSQACRNCHAFEAMEFSKQSDRPRRKHNEAMKNGETCIDCHKGVAHALPTAFRGDDH